MWMSPVPGGMSTTMTSSSPQSVSLAILSKALLAIGPRHATAWSTLLPSFDSWDATIRKPKLMHLTLWFTRGTKRCTDRICFLGDDVVLDVDSALSLSLALAFTPLFHKRARKDDDDALLLTFAESAPRRSVEAKDSSVSLNGVIVVVVCFTPGFLPLRFIILGNEGVYTSASSSPTLLIAEQAQTVDSVSSAHQTHQYYLTWKNISSLTANEAYLRDMRRCSLRQCSSHKSTNTHVTWSNHHS